jgi:hypothetical protein
MVTYEEPREYHLDRMKTGVGEIANIFGDVRYDSRRLMPGSVRLSDHMQI